LPKRLDLVNLKLQDLPPGVELVEIGPDELWGQLHSGGERLRPMIVDVREPREFRQGHIAEALSLPLSTFAESMPDLPQDRPLVIVCRSSRRSRLAAASLRREGYKNITILDGGMLGWEKAGLLEAVEAFPDHGDSL